MHSSEPDGFSVADHRRIPGGRVELLDGILVVKPELIPLHQRAVNDLYRKLRTTCPTHLDPLLGPLDVPVGPATVFRPGIVVRPRGKGRTLPTLVVEVRPDRGSYYRWHERQMKSHGYRDAGVPSYWVLDPDASSVAVYELTYHKRGSYSAGEVCAKGQRNWWRLWPKPS